MLWIMSALALAFGAGEADGGTNKQRHSKITALEKRAIDAEKQYAIVAQTGDREDLCKQGRIVAGRWLEALNQKKYYEWDQKTETECLFAKLGLD